MCQHQPPCPPADTSEENARLVVHHPEQGWALRSDGAVLFEDTGLLLADGQVVLPHRLQDAGRPVPEVSGRSAA
ncbi:hypothetical protein IQ279_25700 [Streptomyces verrucosisporus]|uniref:DUF5999 family protein n=1 Tax=Streptomyces verrucosisporus TaxID=1695161 RepID=UPI0019D05D78|nr:DUF5999 family protein [Streptomyces verrucosisporus]MBN3932960.1 hypothetical protein [Streptomyces verrucosisporus]